MSMLLSELLICCEEKNSKLYDSILECGYCYGIKADSESFSPPESVNKFSFVVDFDKDGELSESLIDVLISYSLSGSSVVLEVTENNLSEIDYIFNVANNIGFDVALVPSNDIILGKKGWGEYVDFMVKACATFLDKNSSISLIPLSGYVEYLFAEYYSGGKLDGLTPTDTFIVEKYLKIIPESISHDFKEKLRDVVYNYFGGKDEFGVFAKSILFVTKEKINKNLQDMQKEKVEKSAKK